MSHDRLSSTTSFQPLRAALLANLIFSLASALTFVFGAEAISAHFVMVPVWLIQSLGLALFGFAALIGFVLARMRLACAFLISVLDIGWVVGSVALTLVPNLFSDAGRLATFVVAGCVMLFGVLQLFGIRFAMKDSAAGPGHYRHCLRVKASSDADALWRVVSDLGSIVDHSEGLSASKMQSDGTIGLGSVRRCTDHQGQSWAEEVADWNPDGRSLLLTFGTQEPDFPFPFTSMTGGWKVSQAADGSLVDIWWSVLPKSPAFGWLIVVLMSVTLDRDVAKIVARMDAKAMNHPLEIVGRNIRLSYC